jgi:N-carbamoylputrescine amidase
MARIIRVAVCENPPELVPGSDAWTSFCRRVKEHSPALLLMNELPFGAWIASGPSFVQAAWDTSTDIHNAGLSLLEDLGVNVVALTRPNLEAGRRVNQGIIWTKQTGEQALHTKQYFPNEDGYFEARWFEPGQRHFRTMPAGEIRCGFLICTELMFNEHARHYGREGAHLILVPRAAGATSLARWLVALRMAAIVSGCYVLSSNRAGTDSRGQSFGGAGWIIDPTGEVVAQTSPDSPVVCVDIDLDSVERAQKQYPCYVRE